MIMQIKDFTLKRLRYLAELKDTADRMAVTVQELKALKSICERKGITLEAIEKHLAVLEKKSYDARGKEAIQQTMVSGSQGAM
jgi:hypothetical protein